MTCKDLLDAVHWDCAVPFALKGACGRAGFMDLNVEACLK